jgi:hypothetical protein
MKQVGWLSRICRCPFANGRERADYFTILGRMIDSNGPRPRATIGEATGVDAIAALALGALAIGGLSVGLLVLGRLIIRELLVRKAHFRHLKIDQLDVGDLRVNKLTVREENRPRRSQDEGTTGQI